jgi:hypothetical protein
VTASKHDLAFKHSGRRRNDNLSRRMLLSACDPQNSA